MYEYGYENSLNCRNSHLITRTTRTLRKAVKEPMFSEPASDGVVLHVGPRGHVEDEVSELLPEAHHVHSARSDGRRVARERERRHERAVHTEHDHRRARTQHRQPQAHDRLIDSTDTGEQVRE